MFWLWLSLAFVAGGVFGMVATCCLVAAKTSDPHSIARNEDPWHGNSSGIKP